MTKSEIIEIIASCSGWDGSGFDPLSYIQAVNKLYGLDTQVLLEAMTDYVHPTKGQGVVSMQVYFILRLLFIPNDASTAFPAMAVGRPVDEAQPPEKDFPIYPLTLIEDVPLLIVPGFELGGLPANPIVEIEFCRDHCHVRTKGLQPPDNPLQLPESLMNSDTWYRSESGQDYGMLRAQILRLVRNIFSWEGLEASDRQRVLASADVWEGIRDAFERLNPIWDAQLNNYRTS